MSIYAQTEEFMHTFQKRFTSLMHETRISFGLQRI